MNKPLLLWTRHHWIVLSITLSVLVFLLWAHYANIEEVAQAQGQVIASSRTQIIQSANDGIIQVVLVNEGQKIKKGQIVVRLERHQAEAAHADSLAKVAALKANLSRLRAEVFDQPLTFPAEVKKYPDFIENQKALYRRRQQALNQEVQALSLSLALARQELKLNQPLLESGDISESDMIRLKRQVVELQGAITNRQNKYFQDAQADMTRAEEDLATQEQVLADRTAVLDRTELRAPSDGLVRKIYLTTPGAKVRAGEVVIDVLPTDSELIVESKMHPADVGFLRTNQEAAIKLDAFDYSIYGILRGKVSYISPDALTEETRHGQEIYYRVHVSIDPNTLEERNKQLGSNKIEIQPGMTAAVNIRTGSRTVLQFITKPITKTIMEALHER